MLHGVVVGSVMAFAEINDLCPRQVPHELIHRYLTPIRNVQNAFRFGGFPHGSLRANW